MVETEFDIQFAEWVESACKDWDYPQPLSKYYDKVYERLPQGIRALLSQGLADGLIVPKGRTFTLRDLVPGKGPYNWFSRYASAKEPAPNWEYFVQVAEFVRLFLVAKQEGLTATFEDDLMDLALYQGGKLIVCYEVKEKASQIQKLIKGIKEYQSAIDFTVPDRGNDPLRKAKYIVERKPDYFVGVAIGARFEYRVTYPGGQAFQLIRDLVPWT